jgi:hypothetical protein
MGIKLFWIHIACLINFTMCKGFWTSTMNPDW